MLTNLLTWWKKQMRDLVPASFRQFEQNRQHGLVAVVDVWDDSTVELFLGNGSRRTSLGQYEASSTALREALARLPKAKRRSPTLRVSADLLLERQVVLPLDAERDLEQVAAYEMDRLTPFRAEEVFWTVTAGQRDVARNQLHVRIAVIPRMRVQAVLADLQRAGLIPAQIVAGETMQPCQSIPLGEGRPVRTWLRSRPDAYSLAGCGVLAIAAAVLPFVLQSVAGASIEAQIGLMRPQAIEAERLRKEIAIGAIAADAVMTARAQLTPPLQAIAMLTDMLPDDTFLTTLSTLQGKLTISGRSAAAARLIGAMAANPLIHNPAFTAPVIRDEISGGEMFSIHAELGT